MTYNGILNEHTGRMIEQGVSVAGAILVNQHQNLAVMMILNMP